MKFAVSLCLLVIAAVSHLAQSPQFLLAAAERAGVSVGNFPEICDIYNDPIAMRVFRDYGAVFIASKTVKAPRKCIFESEKEVEDFQDRLDLEIEDIGGADITLQLRAMESLLAAVAEAKRQSLKITPLDGKIAGLRNYGDTSRLWGTRFYRALAYWERRGRISTEDADRARVLSAFEQVPIVLEWESRGIWFNTSFTRSILTSVAAPGTSQHLSGLAFDVVEHDDVRIRRILNANGWFQTVVSDEPHFTFLGWKETELPSKGLRKVVRGQTPYWTPDLPRNSQRSDN